MSPTVDALLTLSLLEAVRTVDTPATPDGEYDAEFVAELRNEATNAAKADLAQRGPRLLFLHLDPPDAAGHASGGMGPAYLAAVRKVDGLVGDILAMIDEDPDLAASVRVVLTADHGFVAGGRLHDAVDSQNYTVPFVVWGAGVTPGDLYGRNPGLEDPGTARPGYDGPQPIRNLDVADAVLGSLGLPLLSRPGDPPPLRW